MSGNPTLRLLQRKQGGRRGVAHLPQGIAGVVNALTHLPQGVEGVVVHVLKVHVRQPVPGLVHVLDRRPVRPKGLSALRVLGAGQTMADVYPLVQLQRLLALAVLLSH